ncbi:pilus assembly protein [Arcanobacterium hippocoleae]
MFAMKQGLIRNLREAGMVTMEFALTIPFLIAVVLFAISAVIQTSNNALVSDGAREAARAYSLGQPEKEAIKIAKKIAGENTEVKITQHGETAKVEVTKAGTGVFALVNYDFSATHSVVLEP